MKLAVLSNGLAKRLESNLLVGYE